MKTNPFKLMTAVVMGAVLMMAFQCGKGEDPEPLNPNCNAHHSEVHQRLRAAQPRPRGGRRPRQADAGRPRILPPLRDARPESFARHETRRRRRAAARHACRITMQSCPASLRGYETKLQNGLAMMRGRFAMQ